MLECLLLSFQGKVTAASPDAIEHLLGQRVGELGGCEENKATGTRCEGARTRIAGSTIRNLKLADTRRREESQDMSVKERFLAVEVSDFC